MPDFEDIRFYNDAEVQTALRQYLKHPMIKALLRFTFPDSNFEEIEKKVLACNSISDFQSSIIFHTVEKVLSKSSEGLTFSGFDRLNSEESYLYISNHRDIILDTCLLNYVLHETQLVMTASAIGDNLVKKDFLMVLSKLNRNFLVQRSLSPREMLKSSRNLSEYIKKMLLKDKRSVWLAQRQGRTKDGSDHTQQGVLKMLGMARGEAGLTAYFSKLKIVPVAISYEFDPTDILKMPELLAKKAEEIYIKTKNEDFVSIIKGALGQKGRIHIRAGKPINDSVLTKIEENSNSGNDQLQQITGLIDEKIHKNYKLWPSNYIASDLLNGNSKNSNFYTLKEKRQFERRIAKRVDINNALALNSYLLMYANPVINKQALYENKG